MRERLLRAPAWVLAIVSGGSFGLTLALKDRFLDGDGWTEALITGLLMGVFPGAVMGPVAARMNRRVIHAAGSLPPGQLGRAVRLARRGGIPEDPALRRAARQIALDREAQLRGQRPWAVPGVVLMTALSLWLALRGGVAAAVGWLGTGFWLGLLTTNVLMARHLAHRAELLADTAEGR